MVVRESFVSEIYITGSVFHEIDERQAEGVSRFGEANESCICALEGASVTEATSDGYYTFKTKSVIA
jgi:hypothetical protein